MLAEMSFLNPSCVGQGEMLEVNRSLVELCLDSNYISSEGKHALADGMDSSSSTVLQFVSLAGNLRSGVLYKQRESPVVHRVVWKT